MTLPASIPPQHKTTWLIHVLFLPRTLRHIHATRAVCVFPSSVWASSGWSQSSSTCVEVDIGLGWSLASPLSWRCTGDSADVQVSCVCSLSLMHAQVVGAAIIPNAAEGALPMIASESPGLQQTHRRLHKKNPTPKVQKNSRHGKVHTHCCNTEVPSLLFLTCQRCSCCM